MACQTREMSVQGKELCEWNESYCTVRTPGTTATFIALAQFGNLVLPTATNRSTVRLHRGSRTPQIADQLPYEKHTRHKAV